MPSDTYDWPTLLPDAALAIVIIGLCVWAIVALVMVVSSTNGRR